MNESRCRRMVADRADGTCEARLAGICLGYASNAAHRRPRSGGGLWLPSNVLHLCGSGTTGCHGWETMNPQRAADDYGLRVWRYQNPAEVPVLLRYGLVLLDDDGGFTRLAVDGTPL